MLTPEERRGALLLLALMAIGLGWDLLRGGRPAPPPDTSPPGAATGRDSTRAEGAGPGSPTGTPAGAAAGAGAPVSVPLSLNRASAAELESLPGIGPVLARRIVEHRERHGPFRSLDELRAVRGVGPRLLARLAGRAVP